MTLAEARAKIAGIVNVGAGTQLTAPELEGILADHLRYTTYASSTAYSVGDRVRLSGSDDNGRMYRCQIAGTTAASTVSIGWPDAQSAVLGMTITDGTVTWEDDGTDRIGPYDLRGAERDAWLRKASYAEADVDYSGSGLSNKASQESAAYRRRANLCNPVYVV